MPIIQSTTIAPVGTPITHKSAALPMIISHPLALPISQLLRRGHGLKVPQQQFFSVAGAENFLNSFRYGQRLFLELLEEVLHTASELFFCSIDCLVRVLRVFGDCAF